MSDAAAMLPPVPGAGTHPTLEEREPQAPTPQQLAAAYERPRYVEKKNATPVKLQLVEGSEAEQLWKQRRLAPLDDEVCGNECFSKLLKECFKREDNGQEVEVRYCSVCELYYNSGRKKTWDLVANKSALESHVSTDPVHIRRKTHAEQLWRKGMSRIKTEVTGRDEGCWENSSERYRSETTSFDPHTAVDHAELGAVSGTSERPIPTPCCDGFYYCFGTSDECLRYRYAPQGASDGDKYRDKGCPGSKFLDHCRKCTGPGWIWRGRDQDYFAEHAPSCPGGEKCTSSLKPITDATHEYHCFSLSAPRGSDGLPECKVFKEKMRCTQTSPLLLYALGVCGPDQRLTAATTADWEKSKTAWQYKIAASTDQDEEQQREWRKITRDMYCRGTYKPEIGNEATDTAKAATQKRQAEQQAMYNYEPPTKLAKTTSTTTMAGDDKLVD